MTADVFAGATPLDEAALDLTLRRSVPDCAGLTRVERLSGGASQETYRLTIKNSRGEESFLALRRAPGGVKSDHPTAPGLAVEAMLMQAAHAAGVPEPVVHYVLDPVDGLGEGFVMQWLDGEALGARIVRAPELDAIRPRLAFECGQILARIHSIDWRQNALSERLHVVPTEDFVHLMWDRYKAYGTPQPMIDFAARWLLENRPADVELTLVHNDFRNGNVMVSPEGVVAVLDWEVAHIGDPMRDLGWICTNSWRFGRRDLPVGGFGSYDDLFAGYESISATAVDPARVRFWEVFGSYWWAVGCLGMAEHYRNGPDRTVERPGIGRRSSECQVDCVNLIIAGPVALISPSLPTSDDMPRMDELLGSVRDFLHGDVMRETAGRTNFLARVAGNSLDVVLRELAIGPELARRENERLAHLVGGDGHVSDKRWRLVHALRDGSMSLNQPGLSEYLRESVVNRVAIDQPKYSGFVHAAIR